MNKGGKVRAMKNGGKVAMTVAAAKKLLIENGFHSNEKEKEVMNGLFTKQHPTLQVLGAERVYSQSRKISWGISTRYGDCSYNHAEQMFKFSSNLHRL
jgi:hypothetical protein